MVKLIALTVGLAHAGWFTDLCARRLVAHDTYQYETTDEAWILKELDRLKIRRAWGTATVHDLDHLTILQGELDRRAWISGLLATH